MRTLAMYLPQFHRVPENDEWWGEGFTEWTAVKKAKPLFDGQVQPRVPLNKNYYNLENKDTMLWQAGLAKEYGIDGFCFYHYWFKDGKKILEKPAEHLLGWKDVDMPFCFCWATATWARSWTNILGRNSWADIYEGNKDTKKNDGILIEQNYGNEDDWKNHFDYLLNFFKDERYIKHEDKPVFVIDATAGVHSIERMITLWRGIAIECGLPGLYIILMNAGVTSFGVADAVIRSMHINSHVNGKYEAGVYKASYTMCYENYLNEVPDMDTQELLWGMVDYDDTPRRGLDGKCFIGATPESFREYYQRLIEKSNYIDAPFLFLNAWNEWGEGMYLEPDERHGYGYLEAIRNAKDNANITDEWHPDINSLMNDLSTVRRNNAVLKRNYEMALSWITLKNMDNAMAKYLRNNSIKKVAIYGYGTHGKLLLTELDNTDVDVLYAIDKRSSYLKAELPLYALDTESFPEVDVLIISVLGQYKEIELSLKGKVKCPLIELDELINKVLAN